MSEEETKPSNYDPPSDPPQLDASVLATQRRNNFLLIVAGLLGAFLLWEKLNPHHDFSSPTLITALLYSSLDPQPGKSLDKELEHFSCQSSHCVPKDIESIFKKEIYRHTKIKSKIRFKVSYPNKKSNLDLTPPEGIFDGLSLFNRLRGEFDKRKLSFFNSDIRIFIDIIGRSPKSRVERSVGTDTWRVGYVEWVAGGVKYDNYMWNLTKLVHEIGHTLGASDKYTPEGKSIFPDGVVSPNLGEGKTQPNVEIMSGTRPIEGKPQEIEARQVKQLRFGPKSAKELGWLK